MSDDILALSVDEVLTAYRNKTLSPVDVAAVSLRQVDLHNPTLNAMVLTADADSLMADARASEARWHKGEPCGGLDGIVTTIKDGADVTGWPTREGSATLPDTPAVADSPLVANLRRAGAIFLGKTTQPEYGHKGVTDSPVFGITRNPWNTAKTTGGSSGGAGAAAATRMGWLHQGSDGGGSIRIPSSFCGCFGIKPTQGLVPAAAPGVFSKLAASGPVTRTVTESAHMLGEMTGRGRIYADALREKHAPLRIAYAKTINDTPVHPEVAAFVAAAAKEAAAFGTVEEIDLNIPKLVETFNMHWGSIAAWLVSKFPPDMQAKMDQYLVGWGMRGRDFCMVDYMDAELERLLIIDRMQKFFENYDVLLLPAVPVVPFDAGQNMPLGADGQPWEDWTPLTYPANLGQLPAASLPCGVTKDGLPVGLQIVSGPFREGMILNLAYGLEQRLGFRDWIDRGAKLQAAA